MGGPTDRIGRCVDASPIVLSPGFVFVLFAPGWIRFSGTTPKRNTTRAGLGPEMGRRLETELMSVGPFINGKTSSNEQVA